MSTYIEAVKGYVADVPELWFKRCGDGRVYHFDELTQCQLNPTTSQVEVNAGWSLYPTAYLPGQSTLTMNVTSGQFDADIFSMSNNANLSDGEVLDPSDSVIRNLHTQLITASDPEFSWFEPTICTVDQVVMDTLKLNGMPLTDGHIEWTDDTYKYYYTLEKNDGYFDEFPQVTNADGTVPSSPVEVPIDWVITANIYRDSRIAKINNKNVAIGEAVVKWPVYAAGDDCSESAIKGYLVVSIYRCRFTQLPGFDTSYKNAQTFSFELSAMDPKREDKMIYSVAFFEPEIAGD